MVGTGETLRAYRNRRLQGRVRLFITQNTSVTLLHLRKVYHLANHTGTTGLAALYNSFTCEGVTLVLRFLNKLTQPLGLTSLREIRKELNHSTNQRAVLARQAAKKVLCNFETSATGLTRDHRSNPLMSTGIRRNIKTMPISETVNHRAAFFTS